MDDIVQFLDPIEIDFIKNDHDFTPTQLGNHIRAYTDTFPDTEGVDIIIVGTNEYRGAGFISNVNAADIVRRKLYKMFYWHKHIKIADIGNIKIGMTLKDTYSCLKTVLSEFSNSHTKLIVIGGSHDLTLAQSYIYQKNNRAVSASIIDAMVDLKADSMNRAENFLVEMLTGMPNYIDQYNHIGFQSYFTDPQLLNEMNKLGFDCTRVGVCKEDIENIEPIIRESELISFDINSIRYSDVPGSSCSPNGFSGEEACRIAQFAGQSTSAETLGIYGYNPEQDVRDITATQIAQMIWYVIDGLHFAYNESSLDEKENFNQFHIYGPFSDITTFLQSRRTGRWWMGIGEERFIPCSYEDYVTASNNKIPDRWLKAQERDFN